MVALVLLATLAVVCVRAWGYAGDVTYLQTELEKAKEENRQLKNDPGAFAGIHKELAAIHRRLARLESESGKHIVYGVKK